MVSRWGLARNPDESNTQNRREARVVWEIAVCTATPAVNDFSRIPDRLFDGHIRKDTRRVSFYCSMKVIGGVIQHIITFALIEIPISYQTRFT